MHLAGAIPIQVDQQKKSGSTGNQEEAFTVVFILVLLLLLIFRSLLAPLITLIPAFMAVACWPPRSRSTRSWPSFAVFAIVAAAARAAPRSVTPALASPSAC